MEESFLHFIWQLQYFDKENLQTSQNESLSIFRPGLINSDSGPDFREAKLRINAIEWHGDVEIHIKSSDWLRHQHQEDDAYNKVILHVVWDDDKPVFRADGTPIPTLTLKNRISSAILQRYNDFLGNHQASSYIPCANLIHQAPTLTRLSMTERALMQRLEKKATVVHELLASNQNDWEETAYQLLCKNFGFKINSEAFLALGKSLPLKYIAKHRNQILQIEALLFGQAGFLDEPPETDDGYWQSLKEEYSFLDKKYNLASHKLTLHQWKFMRLRPANFPTIRLAQLAQLLATHHNLFSLFKNFTSYPELFQTLQVSQSAYWQKHFRFGVSVKDKASSGKSKLGKTSIENIIINTVVPLLVAYAKAKDEDVYLEKALALLQQIPAERNKITRLWEDLGVEAKTAFDAQGLIELYNSFCTQKKCLSCNIGVAIIKNAKI